MTPAEKFAVILQIQTLLVTLMTAMLDDLDDDEHARLNLERATRALDRVERYWKRSLEG